MRHGETFDHWFSASVAQVVLLSLWQEVQGFGMPYFSVIEGEMKSNVWLRTLTSAMVVAISGI